MGEFTTLIRMNRIHKLNKCWVWFFVCCSNRCIYVYNQSSIHTISSGVATLLYTGVATSLYLWGNQCVRNAVQVNIVCRHRRVLCCLCILCVNIMLLTTRTVAYFCMPWTCSTNKSGASGWAFGVVATSVPPSLLPFGVLHILDLVFGRAFLRCMCALA